MSNTWHILGPGAIGSLFACHLQQAGFQVYLIGRKPETREQHIELREPAAIRHFSFPPTTPEQPVKQLLITVKAHQTAAALQTIQHRLSSDTIMVLMQNGMGAWQALQAEQPDSHIVLATTTEGANRPAPGVVVHAGQGDTFVGSLGPEGQQAAATVRQAWSATQLSVNEDPHILPRLWQKLAINCAINPLTALYDCPNGALLDNPAALEQMQQVCDEVEQVMGLALDQQTSGLFELAKTIAAKTANNISSMLQDVRKQQPTEIDHITGYLLSEAQRQGVECPRNEWLFKQVKSMY